MSSSAARAWRFTAGSGLTRTLGPAWLQCGAPLHGSALKPRLRTLRPGLSYRAARAPPSLAARFVYAGAVTERHCRTPKQPGTPCPAKQAATEGLHASATFSVAAARKASHWPGLTPRSSRAPTAKRQARATVHVIICSAGLAFHRRVRLNSNVRPHNRPPRQLEPCHSNPKTSTSTSPRTGEVRPRLEATHFGRSHRQKWRSTKTVG